MAAKSANQDNSKGSVPPSFHKRFDIEVGYEEASQMFRNRVTAIVPTYVRSIAGTRYLDFLHQLAFELGERYEHLYVLDIYLDSDFHTCLRALEKIYELAPTSKSRVQLDGIIADSIYKSEIDLGIRWKDGTFLKAGAELLDEELVNKPLQWLSEPQYRSVLQSFKKGLFDFIQSQSNPERFRDTIRDMYEAMENMARIVCGNDLNLGANAELFVSRLGLSPHYSKILKEHTDYAHDFRHAPKKGKERKLPSAQEVEAFVYTTGLFIRLAIGKLSS